MRAGLLHANVNGGISNNKYNTIIYIIYTHIYMQYTL